MNEMVGTVQQGGDFVSAIFAPKNVSTLKPNASKYVGKVMEFERGWLITEDDSLTYAGQWAWCFTDKSVPFLWVPEEDLDISNSVQKHAR